MEEILTNAGLTKLQAQTYLHLLEHGATPPNQLTAALKVTRTNAYKVLESLEKLGLATKGSDSKKISYTAEDPIALTPLVAEQRNNIIALEQSINNAMQQLRKNYRRTQRATKVHIAAGKEAIAKAYERQAELRQPIYFVRTRADVPFMGFEAIHNIRVAQGKLSPARYGITQDSIESPKDAKIDKATNLTRTWIDERDYTAPVEWSASGDRLVIQVFDGDGQTIIIQEGSVAEAFRQLWQLLNKALRSSPPYQSLPLKAKRSV